MPKNEYQFLIMAGFAVSVRNGRSDSSWAFSLNTWHDGGSDIPGPRGPESSVNRNDESLWKRFFYTNAGHLLESPSTRSILPVYTLRFHETIKKENNCQNGQAGLPVSTYNPPRPRPRTLIPPYTTSCLTVQKLERATTRVPPPHAFL